MSEYNVCLEFCLDKLRSRENKQSMLFCLVQELEIGFFGFCVSWKLQGRVLERKEFYR